MNTTTPPSISSLVYRIAKTTYVVLVRHQPSGVLTLVKDPGLNKPWSSKNKRRADMVAKDCGGEARTWEDAFNLLRKENPGFEKHLIENLDPMAHLKQDQRKK